MTNTPLGDWNKCLDQHQYNDSCLHELSSPKHFENGHLSTAIFDGSFPIPASRAHHFRPRHRADGHVLEFDGIER